MGSFLKSRRAVSAGGVALILVVLMIFMFGGYFAWQAGLFGGTTTPTGMYQYYDPDLKQTLYFKTKADLDAYVAKKPPGVTGKYPISGVVAVLGNACAVSGVTVEIYVPAASGKLYTWEMVEAPTSAATTGAFTTTNGFTTGARVMIHVVRSSTKYIYDAWAETLVPTKAEGLPAASIGTTFVRAYPLAAGSLMLGLYTGTGAAVSTTNSIAGATSLSKATQAANFEGRAQLILADTWSSFGQDPWIQPSTSKGYEQREYVTVITVALNITGISWKSGGWASISVSTGMKRAIIIKGTPFTPAVLATVGIPNKLINIETFFDMRQLTSNTGVKVDVEITDYQLWDNTKENSLISTLGVNFGYTYNKSASFYFYVVA